MSITEFKRIVAEVLGAYPEGANIVQIESKIKLTTTKYNWSDIRQGIRALLEQSVIDRIMLKDGVFIYKLKDRRKKNEN